jgi:SAM-dependent methyltransferase
MHPEPARPNLAVDAFVGTSAYYVRYRIPNPKSLLSDLIRRSGVTGQGRLLDLACGPGRVTLALASHFDKVKAVDVEPEMIDAGKREAARRGVKNVSWATERAEDFESPPGSYALITIGDAFHRLDQRLVAKKALLWLEPGRCLAILGSYSIFSRSEPWQRSVVDVVRRWSRRFQIDRAGPGAQGPADGPDHDTPVLREAGFNEVESHAFIEPHEWTLEGILGFLYSTSVCSKAALAGSTERFEEDLKAALLAHDPRGKYRENIQWGYTLARKPA